MRLAVFGETTRTKHYLVKRALEAGYSVTVLDRAGGTFRKRKNLSTIEGDNTDARAVKRTVRNADAVVCSLEDSGGRLDDKTRAVLERLVRYMDEYTVRRLVVFTGAQMAEAQDSAGSIVRRAVAFFVEPRPATVAEMLRRTSIDWTVVGHCPTTAALEQAVAKKEPLPDETHATIAKHMINQITDVTHLRSTFLLPV